MGTVQIMVWSLDQVENIYMKISRRGGQVSSWHQVRSKIVTSPDPTYAEMERGKIVENGSGVLLTEKKELEPGGLMYIGWLRPD